MVTLNYRDTRPIYTQIVDGFREQITAEVLREGDKLPSVRELAAQLAINPNTIQRAYRELEAGGWVTTLPGRGCFVRGTPGMGSRRKEELLRTLEETAAALRAMGVSDGEILARLEKGGSTDA